MKVVTALKTCVPRYTRAGVSITCHQRLEVGGPRAPGRLYNVDSLDILVLALWQPEVRQK